MESTGLEYNTSLPKMIIPEYGRNIQRMIDFAKTVEDRNERNRVAQAIINVMGQLNPHLRDVTDFAHKLWDHLFIISEFQLDVDSPYPKPTPETFQTKPELLAYPSNDIRYRHYGKITENLIAKAKEYPEGAERNELVNQIANLMKRSYLTWNRDSVTDDVILTQLDELSKGKLKMADVNTLRSSQNLVQGQPQRPGSNQHQNKKHKNKQNKGHHHKNNNQNFKRKPF